jgi:hypothetical protein
MEAEQRSAAKEQMIALMQAGHRWQEASAQAGIQVSRSTAYRLLRLVCTRGKAADPRWQAWAPCQTANGRADMAGKLLPCLARHSKPCGADGLPGAVRHPNQYRLSEPGPCSPRSGKAHPRGGEKNSRHSYRLNPSGKRAQEDCSWLRLPRCLACSLAWRPLCLRVLLVAIRAWRIFLLGLVICWCERCSFSGRSDWITPGICAATRAMH